MNITLRLRVAPYVGAWIETMPIFVPNLHLTVAPYVGAWIETTIILFFECELNVAPYVGAWIETSIVFSICMTSLSHPMWVRGLKPFNARMVFTRYLVAPYVGAWIET